MSRLIERIQIRCPRERVFAYTQDYGQRLVWDTFLREARLVEGASRADVGVRAWCVSRYGLGMETSTSPSTRPPSRR